MKKIRSINRKGHKDLRKGRKELKNIALTLRTLRLLGVLCG
jgi:hypothetical protein